jgi:O-methyltransferase involved in polyketide biosynthesis
MKQNPVFDRISSTAKMVAYWRALSDIPFSSDVAELMHSGETLDAMLKLEGLSIDKLKFMAPFVEARFKSIISALRKEGVTQVLELASGLSLRGLTMAAEPGFTYVETDLPGIMEEKAQIVEIIQKRHGLVPPKGLYFRAVNALHWEELESVIPLFSADRPLAIIHEGLFMYFSTEEKAAAARHFHRLLSRFGGVWITPDFTVRDGTRLSDSEVGLKIVKMLTGVTQRDLMKNAFDSIAHVEKFFDALGFRVSYASQLDGSFKLSSLETTGLPATVLDPLSPRLWTMRLR